jgi:hypothetical protein
MSNRITVFTTAPADYDGFSTREELGNAGQTCGKQVRRVSMEERDYHWQTMRYGSGLHMAESADGWRKLVAAGLATETQEAPAPAIGPAPGSVAAAAIALFAATDTVNRGVWQVPHAAMVELMRAVEAAGYSF